MQHGGSINMPTDSLSASVIASVSTTIAGEIFLVAVLIALSRPQALECAATMLHCCV